MRNSRSQHRANYDEDGNIILPSDEDECDAPEWRVTDEEVPSKPEDVLGNIRTKTYDVTNAFIQEGWHQYQWGLKDCRNVIRNLRTNLKKVAKYLWEFLMQPVWIISPNKKPRKYNRGTLFALDIVRFGGTFAAIFVLLFVSLNASSFWEIMSEKINPIQHAQNVQNQTAMIDAALKEKLLKSPSLVTAGTKEGDLLSFLPQVGPPENRIIIPKLGINVPLITPSYKSLLNEDWTQVEEDIQDALTMGVVHYPGTARPGQAGNFFVTGHSSYYPWTEGKYKTVFARLHNLEPGDEYYVYYGGDQHRYIIRSKNEVKPTDVTVLDQPTTKRMGTLMTCTPVGTTLRRLVLLSEEVDPVTGEVMKVGEKQEREDKYAKPQMLPI